ncbi:unnamed protein product [Macrosiphum euphorbiae]|uniref:Uncharacterized protein n=1 Tax=Macrosiphum euphorbiae TaxID=13131 RepID=A0AAV0Y6Y8_9HEMI|nr:unnamed protein product [Macrosiphum euphorbiae]
MQSSLGQWVHDKLCFQKSFKRTATSYKENSTANQRCGSKSNPVRSTSKHSSGFKGQQIPSKITVLRVTNSGRRSPFMSNTKGWLGHPS